MGSFYSPVQTLGSVQIHVSLTRGIVQTDDGRAAIIRCPPKGNLHTNLDFTLKGAIFICLRGLIILSPYKKSTSDNENFFSLRLFFYDSNAL